MEKGTWWNRLNTSIVLKNKTRSRAETVGATFLCKQVGGGSAERGGVSNLEKGTSIVLKKKTNKFVSVKAERPLPLRHVILSHDRGVGVSLARGTVSAQRGQPRGGVSWLGGGFNDNNVTYMTP